MASASDPSLSTAALLVTCGGDTVKLFDPFGGSGDQSCVLSYCPSPGSQVHAVKWNHTNLVIASAGDDRRISLWHKSGRSMGTLPATGIGLKDDIEESIGSISFSNKGSRYLCSGGSGRIVRIWDLQRNRCIKWLSGHSDTITSVMYNCKDEHLASISVKGDLVLHNLTSGARAAELKDPNGQVLRVLDYSRVSRHILVTAGDSGSIHLWDTNARTPKMSWLSHHSAPTTGVCFSPSTDKTIASVGLDKKLYIFDSGTRRHVNYFPYEAPFTSLAYNDDGIMVAAGTNNGGVVFFDVRGKPQPVMTFRAYSNSTGVTGLCWQRSKPFIVKESNCSDEIALLGGANEESVLMPDPMPSAPASNLTIGTTITSQRSSFANASGVLSTMEASTPHKSRLFAAGPPVKLQATRTVLEDDMHVFSPLVDVQPITPSLGKWWDEHDDSKRETKIVEDKSSHDSINSHPISEWRSKKEDTSSRSVELPTSLLRFTSSNPSQELTSSTNQIPRHFALGSSISSNLQAKSTSSNLSSFGFSDAPSDYSKAAIKSMGTLSATSDLSRPTEFTLPGKYSSYPDRFSSSSVFDDGMASAAASPKTKKIGAETKEELLKSLLNRQEAAGPSVEIGGGNRDSHVLTSLPKARSIDTAQSDPQHGLSSFSVQLVQRTLEETLGSVHKSIHEDVRNLHIELLRQFHIHEMEMMQTLDSILEKQESLAKEVQMLRRENQQLHQLLSG